eukprot:921772-Prymnesium_polylepis.1
MYCTTRQRRKASAVSHTGRRRLGHDRSNDAAAHRDHARRQQVAHRAPPSLWPVRHVDDQDEADVCYGAGHSLATSVEDDKPLVALGVEEDEEQAHEGGRRRDGPEFDLDRLDLAIVTFEPYNHVEDHVQ